MTQLLILLAAIAGVFLLHKYVLTEENPTDDGDTSTDEGPAEVGDTNDTESHN